MTLSCGRMLGAVYAFADDPSASEPPSVPEQTREGNDPRRKKEGKDRKKEEKEEKKRKKRQKRRR